MRLVAAAVAVLALLLVPAASAHPAFDRGFAPQGSKATLVLVVPNERQAPMTSIELSAPPSVEVVEARSAGAWRGALAGNRASWTGGHVPPLGIARVVVRLKPTGAPGPAAFRLEQGFADGRTVTWPMELTITPGSGGDGGNGGSLLAIALVAVVVAVTVAAVIWLRRRHGSLQES